MNSLVPSSLNDGERAYIVKSLNDFFVQWNGAIVLALAYTWTKNYPPKKTIWELTFETFEEFKDFETIAKECIRKWKLTYEDFRAEFRDKIMFQSPVLFEQWVSDIEIQSYIEYLFNQWFGWMLYAFASFSSEGIRNIAVKIGDMRFKSKTEFALFKTDIEWFILKAEALKETIIASLPTLPEILELFRRSIWDIVGESRQHTAAISQASRAMIQVIGQVGAAIADARNTFIIDSKVLLLYGQVMSLRKEMRDEHFKWVLRKFYAWEKLESWDIKTISKAIEKVKSWLSELSLKFLARLQELTKDIPVEWDNLRSLWINASNIDDVKRRISDLNIFLKEYNTKIEVPLEELKLSDELTVELTRIADILTPKEA